MKILQAHLALLAVNFIYGANYIIAKGVMPNYLSAFGFILLRVVGAAFLFFIVSRFSPEKVAKKDLGRMAFCAIFGVALNQLSFFKGLELTSPLNASIIMTFNPALVLLISAIVLKEKITLQKITGIIIGCIGAIWIILQSSSTSDSNIIGDLLILLNASAYGLYLVLVKPLMKKYKPITVINYVFLFGLIYVIPFGIADLTNTDFNSFPLDINLSILYVVIATTFFAYLLNIFALKNVTPSVSSSYIYLQPFIAALIIFTLSKLGFEQYQNEFTLTKIAAALLIFVGVFFVSSSKTYIKTK